MGLIEFIVAEAIEEATENAAKNTNFNRYKELFCKKGPGITLALLAIELPDVYISITWSSYLWHIKHNASPSLKQGKELYVIYILPNCLY